MIKKSRTRPFLIGTLFAAIAIAFSLLLFARHDVADVYAARRYPERPQFNCIELHPQDPLGKSLWRVTLNFSLSQGGAPVQWHLWPFREIHEEELWYGRKRYCFPPQ
ncbi:hypothetical protein [Rubinisphaera margarita]|uniref:hypothetical protein n=1 Tax=Rubinisphaera margarita TaxID=2909586 RepID=UPI001EE983F9|nr:hypothetical protein [Rubinisphaera margarita]MCG6156081.1 hypothetical protein [Rubinisphaera margarita]